MISWWAESNRTPAHKSTYKNVFPGGEKCGKEIKQGLSVAGVWVSRAGLWALGHGEARTLRWERREGRRCASSWEGIYPEQEG